LSVAAAPKLTEADLLRLIERRFTEDKGNGPAWAFVPHVRDAAGFDAKRTADAIVMSLWPSRGLELIGFEIKCSRTDWKRELDNPAKAEQFCQIVDRWYVVVSDAKIVKEGELPETWGLFVVRGGKLFQSKAAPLLSHERDEFSKRGRSFLAALLRSAIRKNDVTPEEIAAALKSEREHWSKVVASHDANAARQIEDLRGRIKLFEEASGVRLGGSGGGRWYDGHDPKQVGIAVRAALDGSREHEAFVRRMTTLADTAQRLADEARRAAGD
jgi:hypothetical protein